MIIEPKIALQPMNQGTIVQYGNIRRFVRSGTDYADNLDKAIEEVKRLAD